MKYTILSISFLFLLILLHANDNNRLIVLADMGNEPDEMQQMTHILIN